MKNCAGFCQTVPESIGIYQISVVGQRQRSFDIAEDKRLGIGQLGGSRGGIPHMTDPQVAMEGAQAFFFKYLTHQSHALMEVYISSWPRGIADGDAAGLLPSVLEGGESIVDRGRRVVSGKIINAENAAGLFDFAVAILFHLLTPCL